MKFYQEKDSLKQGLSIVMNGHSKRNDMSVLNNILIETKNSILTMMCTDMESQVCFSAVLDKDELINEGSITVPAQKMLSIVKNAPPGSRVSFETKEDKAIVKVGRGRYSLSTMKSSMFPEIDTGELKNSAKVKAGKLKSAIERCAHAMGVNDVRYFLNAMHIEVNKDKLKLVATDGHRMSIICIDIENEGEEFTILAPRKAILDTSKFLGHFDPEALVNIESGYYFFRISDDKWAMSCKCVDGKFIDYEKVIPDSLTHNIRVSRREMLKSLLKMGFIANEKNDHINFSCKNNKLKTICRNSMNEGSMDVIDAEYGGEFCEVNLNIRYVQDAVSSFNTETVTVSLKDSTDESMASPITVTSENDDQLNIVMPLKV